MWQPFEAGDNEPLVWTGNNGCDEAAVAPNPTAGFDNGRGCGLDRADCDDIDLSPDSGITVRLVRHGTRWAVSVDVPAAETVHYTVFSDRGSVLFHPCLPEYPLVVPLPCRHILAPNCEAAFKLLLPCVPKLEIGGISKIPLTYPLKMTFEGLDTIHGELCAVLTTPVKPLFSGPIEQTKPGGSLANHEEDEPPLSVITELVIRNRAKQDYSFDHVVVYPDTIDIFQKNGRLTGGLVLLDYLDSGEIRLQTQRSVPPGYQLVTPGAKDAAGARFFRQSAGFIKGLTTIKVS